MAGNFEEGKSEKALRTPEQLIDDLLAAEAQRGIEERAVKCLAPVGKAGTELAGFSDIIIATMDAKVGKSDDTKPDIILNYSDLTPENDDRLLQNTELDKVYDESDVRRDFHESLSAMEEGGFWSRYWPRHESGISIDFFPAPQGWLDKQGKEHPASLDLPVDAETWHLPQGCVSEDGTSSLDLDK